MSVNKENYRGKYMQIQSDREAGGEIYLKTGPLETNPGYHILEIQ